MANRPMSSKYPRRVTIFEVGPRDGLQNEVSQLPLQAKLELIQGLKRSGLSQIEAGAFVRADRVPQMQDSDEVFRQIQRSKSFSGPTYWALVPNRKGLERALAAGANAIGVFTAVSESFNRRNIGMTVEDSLSEIQEVLKQARKLKLKTRAYLSTVFGCPFEGSISPKRSIDAAQRLLDLGAQQVSLGDTIGVATPKGVDLVLPKLLSKNKSATLAVHFHDTRGTALANTLRALEYGISSVDSSAGGLGGCPFAPGASGNLATEDLVYMLEGMGIHTGVNLKRLCETSLVLSAAMKRALPSRYLATYSALCSR
ncbi:MAG: hydroxymethylglutaryl-CoA lyase [Bdellovibrionales bacterium]|nr:hydroxymethylglutaryl-CoA lyase [Bdellovibrionales bacterium]